jgi:hypothetical protein
MLTDPIPAPRHRRDVPRLGRTPGRHAAGLPVEPPVMRAEPPVMQTEPPVAQTEPPVGQAEPPRVQHEIYCWS